MKILKLLNSNYLSILIVILIFSVHAKADDEPIDIWNLDQNDIEETKSKDSQNSIEKIDVGISQTNIYDLQSLKQTSTVQIDSSLDIQHAKIIGLYDPEDYDLKMDMWSNSNGDQLKYLFSNLIKLKLSEDAADLMNLVLLTNSYYPKINITENEFLKIKSDWLIKNKNRKIIEEYLIKNKILNINPELGRYLVDQYLSESNIDKACKLFSETSEVISDEYLSKFHLYCLFTEGKSEEAQLILDLKKELGFKNEYFEKKINYLLGYTDELDISISENSILEFHLAHKTNPNFIFEPKNNTNPLIWKYLSTSNLLYTAEDIDVVDFDKISLIEKATNDKNYSEEDLFSLYKRFQFSINQLLKATESYKSLSSVEARALIYQKILLESDVSKKLELIELLKNLFIKDGYPNAFHNELKKFLEEIDVNQVPSNFTTFYFNYLGQQDEKRKLNDIKYNKDILHQSKLVNYFNGDFAKTKIKKDLNNYLKKIKKNKKYFISKKDIMLIESIKSDGVEISKKYQNLYEVDENEIPTDIRVMINNNEIGSALLRIIEVIGQDELEDLDEDTLYFIVIALNQLNIDYIRNRILLKVLPLKV